MEKVKTKTQPSGILYTTTGQEYYLLKPAPNAFKDSWQHDHQQRFTGVRREWEYDETTEKSSYIPVGGAIQIICTDPTIELYDMPVIEYETILYTEEEELVDYVNKQLSVEEMEGEERQQMRFDEIFAPV